MRNEITENHGAFLAAFSRYPLVVLARHCHPERESKSSGGLWATASIAGRKSFLSSFCLSTLDFTFSLLNCSNPHWAKRMAHF